MKPRHVLAATVLLQMLLGLRVLLRFARTVGAQRIQVTEELPPCDERVTVIVPVLNERTRLGPCLEGLALQGSEVGEILVVDGARTTGRRSSSRSMARVMRVCASSMHVGCRTAGTARPGACT
jgi:hypothetical protein